MDRVHADPIESFGDGWTKEEVEAVLAGGDARLALVPILVGLHALDTAWASTVCLDLAGHGDPGVRGNALMGLGHLVRRGAEVDLDSLASVLTRGLHDSDEFVRNHADSAQDDIAQFRHLILFDPADEQPRFVRAIRSGDLS